MKALIAKGVDLNARNSSGKTALHDAGGSLGCTYDAVELLVDAGADVNVADNEGRTPLHVVAADRRGNLGKWYVDQTCNEFGQDYREDILKFNAERTRRQCELIARMIEKGADIQARDAEGRTPLHHAAKMGHFLAVQVLLRRGADPNMVTADGKSALHDAMSANVENYRTMKLLIEHGADTNKPPAEKLTPLHLIARDEYLDQYRTLIMRATEYNPDYDASDQRKMMAQWSIQRVEVMELAILKGAELNARDGRGRTPLHYAAERGHSLAVKCLLGHGAEAGVKDHAGETPLDLARKHGHREVVLPSTP